MSEQTQRQADERSKFGVTIPQDVWARIVFAAKESNDERMRVLIEQAVMEARPVSPGRAGVIVAASEVTRLPVYENLRAVRAERDRLQQELEGVHLVLAEANVPRSAGIDELLWSEAHRVRLLYEERDRLVEEIERFAEICESWDTNASDYTLATLGERARAAALAASSAPGNKS